MVDYHYDVSFSMFCQFSSTSNRVSCHKVHQSLMHSMVHGTGLGGGGGGKPDGMVATLLTRQNIYQFHAFCDVFSSYLKSSALKI